MQHKLFLVGGSAGHVDHVNTRCVPPPHNTEQCHTLQPVYIDFIPGSFPGFLPDKIQ